MWDVLIFHLEGHAPDWVIEDGWRDLEWTREPEVRAGVRPLIADECKTAQFLASKGVVRNTEAEAAFLDCVLDELIAAILLLERRAKGDYSVDTRLAAFPKFDGKKIARDARKDIFVATDFDGSMSSQLGEPQGTDFSVFVFGRNGELIAQWHGVPTADQLTAAVK